MALNNPTFVLTQVGINAYSYAIANSQALNVTSFSVGNGYGYDPTSADTALHGTSILHSGAPYSFNIINENTLDIMLIMDTNIGPFNFGEVGLYVTVAGYNGGSPVLFALASYPQVRAKTATAGNVIGDRWKLHCLLQIAQGIANIVVNATNVMVMPEIASWAALPSPSAMVLASSNAAIIQEADPLGNYSVVVKQSNSDWSILGYTHIASDTIGSSTTTTVTAPIFSSLSLDGATSKRYVAKFASGAIRAIQSISGSQATLTGTLSPAPSGTFSLWQSSNYADDFKSVASLAHLTAANVSGSPLVRVEEKDSYGYNSILAYVVSSSEWSFLTHQNIVAATTAVSGSTASVIVGSLPSNLIPVTPATRRYILQFTSGPNAGTARFITGYSFNTGTNTASINVNVGFGSVPVAGNSFQIFQENDRPSANIEVATWSLLGRVQDNPEQRNFFVVGESMPNGRKPIAFPRSSTEWGILGYNWFASGNITSSTVNTVTAAVFTDLDLTTTTNRRYLLKFSSGFVRPVTSIAGGVATIPAMQVAPTGTFEVWQYSDIAMNTRRVPTVAYLPAPSSLIGVDFVLTGSVDDSGKNPVIAYPMNNQEWSLLTHSFLVVQALTLAGSTASSIAAGVSASLIESNPSVGKYLLQFTQGALAGTVREIVSFSAGLFGVTPAFASPPPAGDTFVILQSNVSRQSAVGSGFARNSLLSGQTDVYGAATYLSPGPGLTVNLQADSSSPFILSWANGFNLLTGQPQDHLLPAVSSSITSAWTGLPSNAQVPLFYERDLTSGSISRTWHYNSLRYVFNLEPQDSIPEMTSASSPFGSVTTSSALVNREGFKAFNSDSSSGSGWATAGPTGTLAYMFPGGMGGIPKRYTIQGNTGNLGLQSQEFFYTGSAQTFIVPAGVTSLTVTAVGGGGGAGGASGSEGGNTNYQWSGGGGAGGGAALEYTTLVVTPGQVITINVAAGGTGGAGGVGYNTSGANGTSGGSTTLTSGGPLVTALGGSFGYGAWGGVSGGYGGGATGGAGGAGGAGTYSGGNGGTGGYYGVGPSGLGGARVATTGIGWNSLPPNWAGGAYYTGGGRGGLTLGPAVVPTTVGVGGQGPLTRHYAGSDGAPGYVKLEWNLGPSSTCPKAWTFEGFNGASWVVLDTQTNVTSWISRKIFTLSTAVSYQGFRLNITQTVAGGSIEIDDFEVALQGQALFHLGQKTAYRYMSDASWIPLEINQVGLASTGASSTTSVAMEPIAPRSLVSGGQSDLVDVGAIEEYVGSEPPLGRLRANGAQVSRLVYYRLFAKIGTTYGVGDGVTTFSLPNYTSARAGAIVCIKY